MAYSDLDEDESIDANAEVLQVTDYYPFGMEHIPFGTIVGDKNQYTYNGKESFEEFGLNWMDYRARMYNPALGRWMVVDALAEKYLSHSAYHFSYNSPINFYDKDGNEISTGPHGGTLYTGADAVAMGAALKQMEEEKELDRMITMLDKIFHHTNRTNRPIQRLSNKYQRILESGTINGVWEGRNSSRNLKEVLDNTKRSGFSRTERTEAFEFFEALRGRTVEVAIIEPGVGEVAPTTMNPGDSNGATLKASGGFTGNEAYQDLMKVIDVFGNGSVNQIIMNALFSDTPIVINGETYVANPDLSGDGFIYFSNQNENTQQQSQGVILIDGTRNDLGNDGQRIITAVNLVKQ